MFRHTCNKQMKCDESNCLHTDTHATTYIKLTKRPAAEINTSCAKNFKKKTIENQLKLTK